MLEGDEEMEKNESPEVDCAGGVRVDRPVRRLHEYRIFFSKEDEAWISVVTDPELPGSSISGFGWTPQKALEESQIAHSLTGEAYA